MALQESISVANGRLDSIETTVGTGPLLQFYTGAPPANCAAARTGTKIVQMTLPSDWLANAASGSKAKTGVWSGSGITPGGVAGYFCIMDSSNTTCHLQGTVTQSGAGGDMTLDNTNIAANQSVTVTSFALTDGNS